jgi:hypothetical protein
VSVVEQRAGDDADGVREVDDPRVVAGASPHLLSDVEHYPHRAQRRGKPAGARRFLADAVAAQGQCLVEVSGRLSAHPQLDEDKISFVERSGQVVDRREPSGQA